MKKVFAVLMGFLFTSAAWAANEESVFGSTGSQEIVLEHVDYSLNIEEKKGWITLGGLSKHNGKRIDTGEDYNEFNPGLGYEHPIDENWSISAGVFYNSHAKTSVYLAGFRQLLGINNFRLGISGGLFTGYSYASIVPSLMPTLMYEKERWGLNFFYAPSIKRDGKKVSNNTVIVQLKVRF